MIPLPSPLEELDGIVREAGRIAQTARQTIQSELKQDGSIVTNGDREVETFLRRVLPDLRPGSSVWGEEFGYQAPGASGLWLVDPIDGTSNFSFGSPLWGVSIGLAVDGALELAAINLPDLGETYLAARGEGAFRNGEPLAPIKTGPIRDEELVSYGEWILRSYESRSLPGRMRLSGAFVIDGTFVASQRYRGLIGLHERLYDVAASVLICQELGAEIRYADGSPFDVAALLNERIMKPWLIFPAGTEFRLNAKG